MTATFEGMMSKRDAQAYFRPNAPKVGSEPQSDFEASLREKSIAPVDLGLDPSAFQHLSDQYGVCIDEFPDLLDTTAWSFDAEGVPEDGHVRKDIKFNPAGMQITDPKNLMHFNNDLIARAHEIGLTDHTPSEFSEFIEHGIELHGSLVKSARNLLQILDESYQNMSELYFPASRIMGSVTFRLLRYDGYPLYDETGRLIAETTDETLKQVAKPHYDRGGMTIQAYSSAPGFWIQPDPQDRSQKRKPTDPIEWPEHGVGESQAFFSLQHHAVYGQHDPIQNLYHGVDRIIDTNLERMPVRTAAIAFIDAPLV